MRAPSAGVPPPGGNPLPSGRMLMSHDAISAGAMGWPRLGPAAQHVPAPSVSTKTTMRRARSCIDMSDTSVGVDRPARNAVEMLTRKTRHWRDVLGLAAMRHKLRARRLHVAALVPGAALQQGRSSIPAPRHAETGKSLGEHRLLQRRLRPGLATVGGNHDLRD